MTSLGLFKYAGIIGYGDLISGPSTLSGTGNVVAGDCSGVTSGDYGGTITLSVVNGSQRWTGPTETNGDQSILTTMTGKICFPAANVGFDLSDPDYRVFSPTSRRTFSSYEPVAASEHIFGAETFNDINLVMRGDATIASPGNRATFWSDMGIQTGDTVYYNK